MEHHGIRTIVSGKESMEREENDATCAEERVCSPRFRTSLLQSLRLVRDNFLERSVTSRDSLLDAVC
jgi:hypothetical protein